MTDAKKESGMPFYIQDTYGSIVFSYFTLSTV